MFLLVMVAGVPFSEGAPKKNGGASLTEHQSVAADLLVALSMLALCPVFKLSLCLAVCAPLCSLLLSFDRSSQSLPSTCTYSSFASSSQCVIDYSGFASLLPAEDFLLRGRVSQCSAGDFNSLPARTKRSSLRNIEPLVCSFAVLHRHLLCQAG